MTPVTRAFRRTALPLASYYAVTLAVPLANGAAHSGAAFVEHALAALVVPPIIIVLACAARSGAGRLLPSRLRRLLSADRPYSIRSSASVRG